ncbi:MULTISPECIES: MarR family winged helix-turn-helix transcriptional regulator [unclassified Prosthecochloris]|uniref:MarR family winged helix-turn-helix transcriptional regulator n=1 Tax=unclassified Prosthecochloris TaxID=2632826 RepID=UPI00223D764C|nr:MULTISPECIES: MarR family transcriptional regulator [unclassified Prosthecochloris]UZJ38436.1 MarR family transcriptional regulator [Prosthecochloris sp. SCSIO W1103]UZJ42284.1 MarR family transcriptional regulator [Prosthecochloris sp. SCSIO W1101]
MVEEKDAIKKLIGHQIGITANILRTLFAAKITKYADNISPEQFAVLARLHSKNGLSQSVIAESVLKDDATITRILDSLEKKKLAVRKKAEHDRRSNLAYLTPQGRKLVEKVFPKVKYLNDHLLEGIEKEHIRVVFEVLAKLRENAVKI